MTIENLNHEKSKTILAHTCKGCERASLETKEKLKHVFKSVPQ